MTQLSQAELVHLLNDLAAEASALDSRIDHYWNGEGISQLEIFIDPDLYQYIHRWYQESRAFAQRVAGLKDLLGSAEG